MKQRVAVGPWTGGLNLRDDPQLIADNELQQALNVCIEADGTITNRPGFQYIEPSDLGTTLRAPGTNGYWDKGERLDILGFVGDNNIIVGKASHNASGMWETVAMFRGITSATNPTTQGITWVKLGYTNGTSSSFELVPTADGAMDSVANYAAGGSTTIAQDATNPDSGTKSLKVTATANSIPPSVDYGVTNSSARLNCVPGFSYLVSFRIKAAQSPGSAGYYPVNIQPTFYDAGGSVVSGVVFSINGVSSNSAPYIYGVCDNTGYVTVRATMVVSAAATTITKMAFSLFLGNGATVVIGTAFYVDNLSVKKGGGWGSDTPFGSICAMPYIVKVITYGDYLWAISDTATNMLFRGVTPISRFLNSKTGDSFDSSGMFGNSKLVYNIPMGFRNTPTGGFWPYWQLNGSVYFSPSLDNVFLWKDRMFIVTDDRVYFSKPTDPTVWTAPDGGYFTIGDDAANDRFPITGVSLIGNSLHIFKQNAVYQFTFQNDPNTDGYLSLMNFRQGAVAVTTWKNRIFTVDNRSIYEYSNGQFLDIGAKLNLALENGSYTIQDEDSGTGPSLNIFDKYLVVGPFRKTADLVAPNNVMGNRSLTYSPRYYAMNLFNGAWTQWDAFGGAQYTMPVGDLDTVTCQGPAGTFVGSGNDVIKYANSTLGTKLIMLNNYAPTDNSKYIVDGSSTSGYRIPRAFFESKSITFNDRIANHKVYRIQIDRGLGAVVTLNDQIYLRGGFGANFFVTDNLNSAVTFGTKNTVQALAGDHFGNMTASKFRCLGYSVFYDFYYVNQQNLNGLAAAVKQAFRIKRFLAYVDERSDTSGVSSLNV